MLEGREAMTGLFMRTHSAHVAGTVSKHVVAGTVCNGRTHDAILKK